MLDIILFTLLIMCLFGGLEIEFRTRNKKYKFKSEKLKCEFEEEDLKKDENKM